ncbi:alpha/beta hydrolase-fold protein [Pedobacter sp.]|uniref:alpha/beta hydrolase-fold protein n=1 Tax=Pedobacter sp. TaxID=1411316 RepID=UPI0031DF0916
MKHRPILLMLALIWLNYLDLHAQQPIVNLYDSAQVYYKKKDFKKASQFFDTYYLEQKQGQSNYDTYKAAVASAHVGNMERARYYIKRSAEIGYDLGNYNYFADDPLNVPLRSLPEWKQFIEPFKIKADSAKLALEIITNQLKDSTIRINPSSSKSNSYWLGLSKKLNSTQLINEIKQFKAFASPKKNNMWTMYQIKVNDTLTVPFLVHIPKRYDPQHKTPLYVYLHGAIINRLKFTSPGYIPNSIETKIMDKVLDDAFVIYPFGRKDFGWLYQQDAFETILRELTFVKSLYNIDDNKVYICGHSNGGSGAFWFALNQPSAFASFAGFNFLPSVYGNNTPLDNLKNSATFYGVSASKDLIFPLETVNSIYSFATDHGANWKNFVRSGNHALAFMERDSINFVFDLLAKEKRDPFTKKITWETNNVRNGRNAWIAITALDTLSPKATWHSSQNPQLRQNGKESTVDFYPNKSGAIMATANENHIDIKTSRVAKIKLYISPYMFDLTKPLTVTMNGKNKLSFKLQTDNKTIVEQFIETRDRSFIVSNIIELTVQK